MSRRKPRPRVGARPSTTTNNATASDQPEATTALDAFGPTNVAAFEAALDELTIIQADGAHLGIGARGLRPMSALEDSVSAWLVKLLETAPRGLLAAIGEQVDEHDELLVARLVGLLERLARPGVA